MEISEALCSTKTPVETLYLYTDRIKDYLLIYKARTDHKFLLLNQRAQRIFLACNGQRTIREICSLFEKEGYKQTEIKAIISALGKERVLKISDEFEKSLPPSQPLKQQRALGIWLHITNACNLRCSYCYIDKDKGSMTVSTAERTVLNAIKQCKKYQIRNLSIKFAGGEPLMVWKNILYIIDFTRKACNGSNIKPKFNILSNGTLMKEDIAAYLVTNRIPIAISLDGIHEVNDRQRFYLNGRGSFSEVERGVQILKDSGWKPFILITVTDRNVEELPDLTSYLLHQGLSFRYSFVRDYDQMPTQHLFHASIKYAEVLHRCFDEIEVWMLTKNWNFNVKFCDTNLDHSISRVCGTGKNSVAVDHNGLIALCQMVFDTPIGNINNNGLIETIKTQQVIPSLQEKGVDDYLGCNQCVWKNICAGGCPVFTYKQFGKFDVPSPYCHVFQALIPQVVRLRGIKLIREYEKMKGGEQDA